MTGQTKNTSNKKQQQAKKKKLLFILIPVSLIVVALILFFGLFFGCKPSTPPSLVIKQSTISEKNGKYKVGAGTQIWLNDDHSSTYGNDFLDLKALSDDHKHCSDFIVEGTVDFGFLIDFDMNCTLNGSANELMQWNGNGVGTGVLVGNREKPNDFMGYTGCLDIKNSMTFNIVSLDNLIWGVYFEQTAPRSTQIINGTYTLESKTATSGGVCCYMGLNSHTIVNGTFNIKSSDDAYGLYVRYLHDSSELTVNGIFNILSSAACSYGVNSDASEPSSKQTINGVFTIKSNSDTRGIYFWDDSINSDFCTNGIFSITSTNGNGSGITLNKGAQSKFKGSVGGMFEIESQHQNYSVAATKTTSLLNLTDAQFFAKKTDNAYTTLPIGVEYKWNGTPITVSATSNPTVGDSSLVSELISDDATNPNFSIQVIKEAMNTNKDVYNSACANALKNYINNKECPTVAKEWLEKISNQI